MTFFIQFAVIPKNKKHAVKRGRFARVIDDPKVETNAAQLASLCRTYCPPIPIPGPVRLDLMFVYPWPKSANKKSREGGAAFKTTIPDRDNLHKQVADVLKKMGFVQDDGEIASGMTTKTLWDGPRGMFISLRTLHLSDRALLNKRLAELCAAADATSGH